MLINGFLECQKGIENWMSGITIPEYLKYRYQVWLMVLHNSPLFFKYAEVQSMCYFLSQLSQLSQLLATISNGLFVQQRKHRIKIVWHSRD